MKHRSTGRARSPTVAGECSSSGPSLGAARNECRPGAPNVRPEWSIRKRSWVMRPAASSIAGSLPVACFGTRTHQPESACDRTRQHRGLPAVSGWIVTGILSRRAMRRDMRVQYLVSADRQLEAASNRPLTIEHERSIETAVSDIVLLGSSDQVALAESFARAFANDGTADTGPLLEELRRDLRKELMLEQTSPRTVWLRVGSEGSWAIESARVRARLDVIQDVPASRRDPQSGLSDLAGTDPLEAVLAAYALVEQALLELAPGVGDTAHRTPGTPGREAVGRGLISPPTADAIEGVAVMRNLAVHGRGRLTKQEADEFVALAQATEYAVRHDKARPGADNRVR